MESWDCFGIDGQRVPHGKNFVPGPDICTVCKCEKGSKQFCKAVLCQPPTDCKSFRVGTSCCDFICTDDILPSLPDEGGSHGSSTDLGLRMVASAVTAVLSLSLLLFLIHRLRQRKLRAQHLYEDQIDSHNGPQLETCHSNSCCHSVGFCNRQDSEHVDFFLDGTTPPYTPWKNASFYYPHREPPPSYNEAIANSYPVPLTSQIHSFPVFSPLVIQLPLQCETLAEESVQNLSRISPGVQSTVSRVSSSNSRGCNEGELLEESAGATGNSDSTSLALRSDEVYEDWPIAFCRKQKTHNKNTEDSSGKKYPCVAESSLRNSNVKDLDSKNNGENPLSFVIRKEISLNATDAFPQHSQLCSHPGLSPSDQVIEELQMRVQANLSNSSNMNSIVPSDLSLTATNSVTDIHSENC